MVLITKFLSSKSSLQFAVKSQGSLWLGISYGGVLPLSDHHKAIRIVKTAPLLNEMCFSIIPLIKGLQ